MVIRWQVLGNFFCHHVGLQCRNVPLKIEDSVSSGTILELNDGPGKNGTAWQIYF